MGTRGLYGFRKDGIDKTTYNHYDSYPGSLGCSVAELCAFATPEMLEKIYDSIVLIDEDVPPTPEQIKQCVDAGYYDSSVSNQSKQDWYCLLRNLQGELEEYKKNATAGRTTFMADNRDFIKDSLFCEYAYIINLDTQKIEFYVGFQHGPQPGNRYGEEPDENGYYPCRLALEIPLGSDHTPDEIVEMMGKAEQTAEQEAKGEMKLKQKYLDVLEKLDWTISSYTGDGRVEIGKGSPAGEDFMICVEVENFPEAVREYAADFDVDEHIEMWVEARHNGVRGVPTIRELVKDAEDIEEMLEELATAISAAEAEA